MCNDLVKFLCEDKRLECGNAQKRKYRRLAYEIFLGAGKKDFKHSVESVDPIEEINIHKFELEINSKNAQHELQVLELRDCVNDLENVRSELTNSDVAILTFLTALRQTECQNLTDCVS